MTITLPERTVPQHGEYDVIVAGGGGGAGGHLKGNFKFIFITRRSCGLGQRNIGAVYIICSRTGSAGDPVAAGIIVAVCGGFFCRFSRHSADRNVAQKHAEGEHDAQDFLHFTIHDLYLLLK